jgi:hypothetical protein
MWVLTLVLSLAIGAQGNNNNNQQLSEVFFRHRGYTVNTLGHVHIHMFVNVSRMLAHLDVVAEAMDIVRLTAAPPKGHTSDKWWFLTVARMTLEDVRRL